jgi:hypothetical protein
MSAALACIAERALSANATGVPRRATATTSSIERPGPASSMASIQRQTLPECGTWRKQPIEV